MAEIIGAGEALEASVPSTHEALEGNASLNEGMETLLAERDAVEGSLKEQSRQFIDGLIEENLDSEIDHIIEVAGYNGHFEYDAQSGIQYDVHGFGKLDVDTKSFDMSFLRQVRDADIIAKDPNRAYDMRGEAKYVTDKLNARMDKRRAEMETNKSAETSRIANVIIENWGDHEGYIRFTSSGKAIGMVDAKIPSSIQEAMNQYGITESDIIALIAPEALRRREIRMAELDADFAGENDTQLTGLNDVDVTTLESNIRIAGNEENESLNQESLAAFENMNFHDYPSYTAAIQAPESEAFRKLVQETVGAEPIDGIYGAGTAEAVKVWQEANGLDADGVFGPESVKLALENTNLEAENNQYVSNSYDTYNGGGRLPDGVYSQP